MEIPQKIKIKLPYDSAIPLLGLYPKELKSGSQKPVSALPYSLQHYSQLPRYGKHPHIQWQMKG